MQHEKKLDELIAQRQDDINQFFTIAGFPYNFCLEKDGEKHAKAYLVPCEFQKEMVVDPKNRLSWGEKMHFRLLCLCLKQLVIMQISLFWMIQYRHLMKKEIWNYSKAI